MKTNKKGEESKSRHKTTPTVEPTPEREGGKKVTAPEDTKKVVSEPAPNAKVAKVHLMVDLASRHIGLKELGSGLVGHTWVSVEWNDPTQVPDTIPGGHKTMLENGGKYADSMGFWPDLDGLHTEDGEGVGYKQNIFKSWVQGHMRNPDDAYEGSEKATMTYQVTTAQAQKALRYADSKVAAPYSVYHFNCSTFARDFVKAAGHSAPSMGAGICLPDKAYDSILGKAKKGKEGAEVKGGVGNNEAYVNEGDIGVKWKQRPLGPGGIALLEKPNVLEVESVRPGSPADGILKVGDCVAYIDGIRCNSEMTFRRASFGKCGEEMEFALVDLDFLDQLESYVGTDKDTMESKLSTITDRADTYLDRLCKDVKDITVDKLEKGKGKKSGSKGKRGKGGEGTTATL
jgi:hypothetical protein